MTILSKNLVMFESKFEGVLTGLVRVEEIAAISIAVRATTV